ncbi:MAG: ABC transporter permease [Dehalococcoidia bacterium]|jgi:peptide/nickel transport system permease protein|nr:ABC transporter permease [Dehalococcoidia bacterium]
MTAYLLTRLGQAFIVFFIFLTMVFFLVQAQPGDFSSFYALDPNIPPESRAQIRASFGLDQPMWRQYLTYVGNVAQGDLGTSFQLRRPVWDVLMERLPRTFILFATAAVISFYLGFVLGKMIAWRRGQAIEYLTTISGVYLFTVFTPWFALVMMWFFSFKLGWFPIGKFISPQVWRGAEVEANSIFNLMLLTAAIASGILLAAYLVMLRRRVKRRGMLLTGMLSALVLASYLAWDMSGNGKFAWDILTHMALPVIVVTAISFAGTMLLTRNAMLETVREDYVLAARAKGLPDRVVRDRHAARNAMLPVVTSFVFSVAFALDGGIITETIFSWPGIGLTLLDSAGSSDLPMAVGAFVFTGVFALVAHFVADALYMVLDPRIRT